MQRQELTSPSSEMAEARGDLHSRPLSTIDEHSLTLDEMPMRWVEKVCSTWPPFARLTASVTCVVVTSRVRSSFRRSRRVSDSSVELFNDESLRPDAHPSL